jgi:hypothetical protein
MLQISWLAEKLEFLEKDSSPEVSYLVNNLVIQTVSNSQRFSVYQNNLHNTRSHFYNWIFSKLSNPTIKWTTRFSPKNSVCNLYLIILCPAYPMSSFAVKSFHQYNLYAVARYQVITAVFIFIQIFCDVTLCRWMNSSRSFEGPYCQHLRIKLYKGY